MVWSRAPRLRVELLLPQVCGLGLHVQPNVWPPSWGLLRAMESESRPYADRCEEECLRSWTFLMTQAVHGTPAATTPEARSYGMALMQILWPVYHELALENSKLKVALELEASRTSLRANQPYQPQREIPTPATVTNTSRSREASGAGAERTHETMQPPVDPDLLAELSSLRDRVFVLEMHEACQASKRYQKQHLQGNALCIRRAKWLGKLRLTAAQLCSMIPGSAFLMVHWTPSIAGIWDGPRVQVLGLHGLDRHDV